MQTIRREEWLRARPLLNHSLTCNRLAMSAKPKNITHYELKTINLLITTLVISSVICTTVVTKSKESVNSWTGRPEEEPVLSDFKPDPANAGVNPRPAQLFENEEEESRMWPQSVIFEAPHYDTLVVGILVVSNIVIIGLVVAIYYTPVSQLSTK